MLEFKPTKAWLKDHKYKPKECPFPNDLCYCILDHFNKHSYGFCVGLRLENKNGLDMIAFCDRAFDEEDLGNDFKCRLWHPSEALLIATFLSFSVGQAWHLMPEVRKQLGNMGRKRTRDINRGIKPKEII